MIEAYLGLPGAGKSYCMVYRVYKFLRRKWNREKTLYSNMPINEKHTRNITGWKGKLEYLYDWEQLVEAENGLIIIDELNLWMPSRVWAKVPTALLWKWAQVRKSGLEIWYTAQSPARVDKVVRELTFESHHMTSFKLLNFFTAQSYLGIQDKKMSVSIIPFRKKAAKIYDTEAYIAIPTCYQKEMNVSKYQQQKSQTGFSKRNEALEKEKQKEYQESPEEHEELKEKQFLRVSGENKELKQEIEVTKPKSRFEAVFDEIEGKETEEEKEHKKRFNPDSYFDLQPLSKKGF